MTVQPLSFNNTKKKKKKRKDLNYDQYIAYDTL